jgi:hypothetical protein
MTFGHPVRLGLLPDCGQVPFRVVAASGSPAASAVAGALDSCRIGRMIAKALFPV